MLSEGFAFKGFAISYTPAPSGRAFRVWGGGGGGTIAAAHKSSALQVDDDCDHPFTLRGRAYQKKASLMIRDASASPEECVKTLE